MNVKKIAMLVLGFVAFAASAKEVSVNLTKEFADKKYSIKKAYHSVDESLFQGRSKYGISGAVGFDVDRSRGKSQKSQCKYGRQELLVDGPAVDMPKCQLSNKLVFGKYNFNEMLVTNQLIKVDQRKPGEKDPYCTKHVVNTTFKIVPEDMTQAPVNFGHSEAVIYSTCLDTADNS